MTGPSTSCIFTPAPRGRGTPVPRFLGALSFSDFSEPFHIGFTSTRRSLRAPDDNRGVSEQPAALDDPSDDPGSALLALYDTALPRVYGYLLSRCGRAFLAEDLTAETFLAAVDAVRRDPPPLSTPWLVGVARHKLADHWRRQAREERGLPAAAGEEPLLDDPWDAHLDAVRARQTLGELCTTLASDMGRFGVMKHLRVLEDSGLVVTQRQGREKRHYLNPVPIQQIHDRWINKYRMGFTSALAGLKEELESKEN